MLSIQKPKRGKRPAFMAGVRANRRVVKVLTLLGSGFVDGCKTMRTRVSSGVRTAPDHNGGQAVQSEPPPTDKAVFKIPFHGVKS